MFLQGLAHLLAASPQFCALFWCAAAPLWLFGDKTGALIVKQSAWIFL